MLTLSRMARAASVLAFVLLFEPVHALEIPDCKALEQWAAELKPSETFAPAPEVKLSNLLRDELVVPLFGAPATSWSNADITQIRNTLNGCRSEAKDNTTARQLYDAIKAIDRSRSALNRRRLSMAHLERTVDRLLEYRPSRRLAGQLALAREVLLGSPADLEAYGLQKMPNWVRKIERARDYLGAAQMEPLAQRLAERETKMRTSFEEDDAAIAALVQELAEVPVSPTGLSKLRELERSPVLRKAAPHQIDEFRAGVQRKRAQIQARVRRQEQERAQQAERGARTQRQRPAVQTRQRQQAEAGALESRDQVDEQQQPPAPEADPERQSRLAKQLTQHVEELGSNQFDELADLGTYLRRLQFVGRSLRDKRNSEAATASGIEDADVKALYQRFLTAVDELQPKFLDYLASLPESKKGLNQARRAVARATGVRYADDVMQEYLAAAKQRVGEIQAALVHARDYMDVSNRVDVLLHGSSVSRASLGTLTPGMQTDEVIRLAREQWGYRKTPTMDLKTVLTPTREAISKLKKGRRDGGRITVSDMDQRVGQIEFVEHFKAKMELDLVRDQLAEKYGSPDSEQKIEYGYVWDWKQRDRRLQVKAKNQADVIMHGVGFRSRLAVALWNDRYEDYLVKVNKRCDSIRKKPQSERSMDDAAFFMKHQCPMVGGYRLEPGLDD